MGNPTNKDQRAIMHARRLDWLKAHPQLLSKLPGATDDHAESYAEILFHVMQEMQRDGLYAKHSEPHGLRWSIRLLVSEIRGQHVPTRSKFGRGI